ncbi:hypothetical protein Q0Z83_002410 [Actinoplanes sichuanensis]|uniref:Uncharacterized protein n=1 Tax=Actinoplanes sichuanensis TaxID=512349 RepID=A0ABW4ASW2_9ACTN|nr:hypothetical protein [Actinoplanes sichuanensis]BEL02050.1 hypothetical protein Q0Z83_002410 [Actinoplanes sichuanensis]
MEFSLAQYEAVMAEIESGTRTLEAELAEVGPAADRAANQWWVPPPIGDMIRWIGQKTVELGREILAFIGDLLKGMVAPVVMFYDAFRWMDLKGAANGVATDLGSQNLVVDDTDWTGKGRDAYLALAQAQSAAAARVGSISGNASGALMISAAAGLAFYLALAAVIAKLIIACTAATGAFASVIFSEIGAMIFVEEGIVNVMVIAGAVTALAAFLGAQANTMIALHSDAVDPSSFPAGAWPKANTGLYGDATVKDGDADWSLKER